MQVVTGVDVFHGDEDETALWEAVTMGHLQRKNQPAPPVHSLRASGCAKTASGEGPQPHRQALAAKLHHVPQPGVSGRAPAAVKASHGKVGRF